MQKLLAYLLVFGLVVFAVGCDSEEELSEAELFVGSWTVVQVENGGQDVTQMFAQAGSLDIDFAENDEFTLTFSPADGSDDLVLSNEYIVEEVSNTVTLMATNPGDPTQEIPLALSYDFDGEDQIEVRIPGTAVAIVGQLVPPFQAFQGEVTLVVERN